MVNIPAAISKNLRHVIRGKDEIVELVLTALFANGHILIEDVPGVGKTTLAKCVARSISGEFRRVQFTPDLMPTDITGGMVYSPKTGEFSFRPGPVFCNVLLADEINRASPRTQAALLEAMNENQASFEGQSRPLPAPFLVVATQNPIEYHGTYPLPEAQLDRFALRIEIGYPAADEEIRIVMDQREKHPLTDLKPVAGPENITEIQKEVRKIEVEPTVIQYMTEVVRATREDPRLQLGASPRASLVLYRTCQSLAYIRNREFVIPDDVKELVIPVLAHRVACDTKASYAGMEESTVLKDLLTTVRVPM